MKLFAQTLKAAYSADTCHPSYLNQWSPANPTAGQCAITALLVHEKFGYDIYEVKVNRSRHFFNVTPAGDVIDLTAEQFSKPISYTERTKREPNALYRSCQQRLNILKQNLHQGGAL